MSYEYKHDEDALEDVRAQVAELGEAVVGHRIVDVQKVSRPGRWYGVDELTEITLDSGKRVQLREQSDCCAYTELERFLLNPSAIDHVITSVTADEQCEKWFVLADMEQILQLDLSWGEGNYPYYPFGLSIEVVDIAPAEAA